MPGSLQRCVYWDWDLGHEGMTWDAAALAALAFGPVPAEDWQVLIHPDDQAAVVAARQQLASGSLERWQGRYRMRAESGRYERVLDRAFLVRHAGSPHRVVGVLCVDPLPQATTGPPSLRQRLADTERRFETFVESLPLLAWEADAQGWIDFYNQRWYDYTQTTLEQMEGWGWVTVHDPVDLPRMLRVWRNALLTGEPWEDEFRLRRGSDGMLRWHLSRATPVRNAAGEIVRWFGTNTDIHDQKLALVERERLLVAEQELRRRAERMNTEKDEFLAIVSHELRTPLNAIMGWAQLLAGEELSGSEVVDGAQRVARNAAFLAKLIDDLLDASRIIGQKLELEREVVDPLQVAARSIEALDAEAKAREIEIVLDSPASVPAVLGDQRRLQQALCNLIGNAIKFSDTKSRVGVSVHQDGHDVVFVVRDDGEGIAPESLPRLFERFRQGDTSTRRRHGGLGLGLSIVRSIAELHGGEVSADSAGLGQGATFTLRLGAADVSSMNQVGPTTAQHSPPSLAGIVVLAVDDDDESRALMARALLSVGATVRVVGSVSAALEALRAQTPDIVVSDIAMPEVDGYGLVERLRNSENRSWAELPIVAVTAHASVRDRAHALSAGFSAYVSKPVDIVALAHVLVELVAQRVGGAD